MSGYPTNQELSEILEARIKLAMNNTPPNWQEYLRRRKLYSLVLWGFLPFAGFSAVFKYSDFRAHSVFALSLAAAWLVIYFYAFVRVCRFPCPQCKKPFHSVFRNGSEFSVVCQYCDCQMPANLVKS
jgi:hypothetical protein